MGFSMSRIAALLTRFRKDIRGVAVLYVVGLGVGIASAGLAGEYAIMINKRAKLKAILDSSVQAAVSGSEREKSDQLVTNETINYFNSLIAQDASLNGAVPSITVTTTSVSGKRQRTAVATCTYTYTVGLSKLANFISGNRTGGNITSNLCGTASNSKNVLLLYYTDVRIIMDNSVSMSVGGTSIDRFNIRSATLGKYPTSNAFGAGGCLYVCHDDVNEFDTGSLVDNFTNSTRLRTNSKLYYGKQFLKAFIERLRLDNKTETDAKFKFHVYSFGKEFKYMFSRFIQYVAFADMSGDNPNDLKNANNVYSQFSANSEEFNDRYSVLFLEGMDMNTTQAMTAIDNVTIMRFSSEMKNSPLVYWPGFDTSAKNKRNNPGMNIDHRNDHALDEMRSMTNLDGAMRRMAKIVSDNIGDGSSTTKRRQLVILVTDSIQNQISFHHGYSNYSTDSGFAYCGDGVPDKRNMLHKHFNNSTDYRMIQCFEPFSQMAACNAMNGNGSVSKNTRLAIVNFDYFSDDAYFSDDYIRGGNNRLYRDFFKERVPGSIYGYSGRYRWPFRNCETNENGVANFEISFNTEAQSHRHQYEDVEGGGTRFAKEYLDLP